MRDLSFFLGCMCPLTKKKSRPQPGPPIKTGLEQPLVSRHPKLLLFDKLGMRLKNPLFLQVAPLTLWWT